ncbi:MAG: DUF29 domain-containing protein [Gammaproteobacteria bacterium]
MATKPIRSASYDQDFHAWALQNARALRAGRLSEIDAEHIAEELESMGAAEKRELLNRLQVLIVHLLKHQFQPERRGKSWLLTIRHQRTGIERLLEQSPSLQNSLTGAKVQSVYEKAVKDAVLEADLDLVSIPPECPYALAQLLDEDYLPEA